MPSIQSPISCRAAQRDLRCDRADQRAGQLRLAGGAGPGDARAQVRPQLAEAGDALLLAGPSKQVLDPGDLAKAPSGVPFGDCAAQSLALQLLGRELAHGLQQPEPSAGRHERHVEHRPLDQGGQGVVELVAVERRVERDGLGRIDVERSIEDGQPLEQPPFERGQQVVGPPDGRVQGPVPGRTGLADPGRPEAVVQPRHQVGRPEHPGPGGGQLDGQRYAVETAADLLDVVPMGVRVKGLVHCERPDPEQLHAGGETQRPDRHDLLVVDAEPLPRRRQDLHPRTAFGDGLHEFGRARPDMLTVVDEEQRRPGPQRCDDRLRQAAPRSLGDPEGVGHRPGHVVR